MDPNATLADIRQATSNIDVDRYERDDYHVAELVALIAALDEWITKGGFLPDAWLTARDAGRKRR